MAASEPRAGSARNGLDELCSGAMRRYSLESYFCFRYANIGLRRVRFKETAEVVAACG